MTLKPPVWLICSLFAASAALGIVNCGVTQEPATPAPPAADQSRLTTDETEKLNSVSVTEARERARMLHDVYEATLRTIHLRYFKENTGVPIPSRALEDVFARVTRRSKVTARWIAVNSQAMSLDHEPEDDFEKEAAQKLSAGQQEFEQVENGRYRRAAPILLFDSCLKCHAPPPIRVTNSRFAGLVISMPVQGEADSR